MIRVLTSKTNIKHILIFNGDTIFVSDRISVIKSQTHIIFINRKKDDDGFASLSPLMFLVLTDAY